MKKRAGRNVDDRVALTLAVLLAAICAAPLARATTYTWTNTGPNAVDYWTNSVNWSPSTGVPGEGAAADTVNFTRSVANAYTGILDRTPTLPLSVLTLSNNLGVARLLVRQGAAPVTLTAKTFTLGTGGQLQIDAGGTVNVTNSFSWAGTNCALYLNNGGTFATPYLAYGLGGAADMVGQVANGGASGSGGAWDFRTNQMYFGYGPGNDRNALTINNATLTNGWISVGVTANGNSLTLTNNAAIIGVTNFNFCYLGGGAVNNVMTVRTGCVWNINAGLMVGTTYSSVVPTGNLLLVDGGTLTNVGWGTYGLIVANSAGAMGNSVIVTNGGQIVGVGLNITVGSQAGAGANSFTVNGGSVTGFKGLTIGANGGNGSSVKIVNGTMFMNGLQDGGIGSSSGSNNALYVCAGGLWQNGATAAKGITVGNTAAASNLLWVESGAVTCQAVTVGAQLTAGGGNAVVITNGGQIAYVGDCDIGSLAGVGNNQAVVTGTGSRWSVIGTNVGAVRVGYNGNGANTLRIECGGLLAGGADNATVGYKSTNNAVYVTSGGSWTNGGYFEVGLNGGVSNRLVVDGGTLLGTRLYVGYADTAVGNRLIVTNGGQVLLSDRVYACGNSPSNCFDNVIQLAAGGLLEANTVYVNGSTIAGAVSGNMLTNAGGIYQFTSAAPAITLASNGMVYITSGTVSFRAITNADVFCNQGAKPLDSANKMAWAGTNAFRLNNATNLANASQTYVFDVGPATNFYRLDMVNGGTRYRGQAGNTLTIGAHGQMRCSNTTAYVDLAYTNNGTLMLVNSTLTLANSAAINGTVVIDLASQVATNVVAANALTLGTNSALILTGVATTNLNLFTYSGALNGAFGSVAGVPTGYLVKYRTGGSPGIVLQPCSLDGTVIMAR